MSNTLKRVKINGSWYDAKDWMGVLELTKFGSPDKFKAKEPFIHIPGLYHVFDANDNKIGEIDVGNNSRSGSVDDYEAEEFEPEDTTDYSEPDYGNRQEPGCLGMLAGYLFFLFKSNWGGRIGMILGTAGLIFLIVTGKGDTNVILYILVGIVAIFLLGTVGAGIGALVKLIMRGSKTSGSRTTGTAPGKGLLKVTGILFLINGGLGLMGLASTFLLASNIITMSTVLTGIVGTGLGIYMGILGIKYSQKTEKAKFLMILAVISICFCVVSIIITYLSTGMFSGLSSVGFILPVLYLIGALRNMKAS